jgi:predicted nucleotidyltransferase
MATDENITKITRTIREFVQPEKIILFGSRTHGTAHRYSDYDIAVSGVNMDHRTERQLKQALDDRLGVFTVDLIFIDKVDKQFRDMILKSGEVVYEN